MKSHARWCGVGIATVGAFLLCVLSGCGSVPQGGEAFHRGGLPRRLAQESKAVFGDKQNLMALGLATAASVGVWATLDRPIEDALDDNKPLRSVEPLGDFAGYALPVALVVGTRAYAGLAGDEEALKAGKAATDAALLAFVYGEAVVSAVGRERPRGDRGPSHFEPFAHPGNRSFPMLHPAVLNAQLKALSMLYPDNKILKPYVRYPVTGLIAYLRKEKGSHWASAVLPGFVLSEIIGREVGLLYRGEPGHRSWSIVPVPGGLGVCWRF